jgi:hypothetical protein
MWKSETPRIIASSVIVTVFFYVVVNPGTLASRLGCMSFFCVPMSIKYIWYAPPITILTAFMFTIGGTWRADPVVLFGMWIVPKISQIIAAMVFAVELTPSNPDAMVLQGATHTLAHGALFYLSQLAMFPGTLGAILGICLLTLWACGAPDVKDVKYAEPGERETIRAFISSSCLITAWGLNLWPLHDDAHSAMLFEMAMSIVMLAGTILGSLSFFRIHIVKLTVARILVAIALVAILTTTEMPPVMHLALFTLFIFTHSVIVGSSGGPTAASLTLTAFFLTALEQ